MSKVDATIPLAWVGCTDQTTKVGGVWLCGSTRQCIPIHIQRCMLPHEADIGLFINVSFKRTLLTSCSNCHVSGGISSGDVTITTRRLHDASTNPGHDPKTNIYEKAKNSLVWYVSA
jgi:hypothetical protein